MDVETDNYGYVTKVMAQSATMTLQGMPDGSYRLWIEDEERAIEIHLLSDREISVRVETPARGSKEGSR